MTGMDSVILVAVCTYEAFLACFLGGELSFRCAGLDRARRTVMSGRLRVGVCMDCADLRWLTYISGYFVGKCCCWMLGSYRSNSGR
ncbi:hypothetical protein HOY80DRAFT_985426 [Tuber brumale]|nr:hypothetical protein HOY80DRAFT_985426 [Tuber brumale]